MSVPDFQNVYWNGDGIKEIADAMIASYQELSWMRPGEGNYQIEYFWKQKGGMKGERPILGVAKKASAIIRHLTEADFVIEMAADHCRALANYEFEAALFHQLMHLGEREIEDTDADVAARRIPITRPHELEMFEAEITRYGLWSMSLRSASQVFHTQLKMDLGNPPKPAKNAVLSEDASYANGDRVANPAMLGVDELERRRKQQMADAVAAKGDGVTIVYDDVRDEFSTGQGDIYAAGAIEESAGVGAGR